MKIMHQLVPFESENVKTLPLLSGYISPLNSTKNQVKWPPPHLADDRKLLPKSHRLLKQNTKEVCKVIEQLSLF